MSSSTNQKKVKQVLIQGEFRNFTLIKSWIIVTLAALIFIKGIIIMNIKMQEKGNSSDQINLKILAFGIAKDVIGGSELMLSIPNNTSVGELKQTLLHRFPRFGKLASLAVAVNNEYADNALILTESDEVVIIPPVSGG